MPDPNKLAVLADVDYRVQPCCRLCKHARFAPASDYGQCAVLTYEHEKHTETRQLTVHQAGRCGGGFEWNDKKKANVYRSGFERFVAAEVE
jgi:hypothetical protein